MRNFRMIFFRCLSTDGQTLFVGDDAGCVHRRTYEDNQFKIHPEQFAHEKVAVAAIAVSHDGVRIHCEYIFCKSCFEYHHSCSNSTRAWLRLDWNILLMVFGFILLAIAPIGRTSNDNHVLKC